MRTADFLLETLSHFIKLDSSPPPGVPVHAGDEFEKELMAVCHSQGLAPIMLDSLDRLSLNPRLSHISIERLRGMARAATTRSRQVLKQGAGLADLFAREKIPCRVIGAGASAATLYPQPALRRVTLTELLVHENDWPRIITLFQEQEYRLPDYTPAVTDTGAALAFFQYVTPCVLSHPDRGTVALRFRMNGYGPPEPVEPVWERGGERLESTGTAECLSAEDRLIQAVLEWNASGMCHLLKLVDIGLLLRRYRNEFDWEYIGQRLNESGFYSGFVLSLAHAAKLLKSPAVRHVPAQPGSLKREIFTIAWRTGSLQNAGTRREGNPLKFYLLECGLVNRKLRLLKRLLSPERAWVTARYGNPYTLWARLKFIALLLRGATRAAPSR